MEITSSLYLFTYKMTACFKNHIKISIQKNNVIFKDAHRFNGHLVLHYCCVLHWHSELCSSITVSVKSQSREILTLFWYPERLGILYNNFMDMTVEEVLHKQ
jgi:hypothetical protein